jgi:hypothetical protein
MYTCHVIICPQNSKLVTLSPRFQNANPNWQLETYFCYYSPKVLPFIRLTTHLPTLLVSA